jgi:hypothetical protein
MASLRVVNMAYKRVVQQERQCERPGCTNRFTQDPRIKYCSDECRGLAEQAKLRESNVKRNRVRGKCPKCGAEIELVREVKARKRTPKK